VPSFLLERNNETYTHEYRKTVPKKQRCSMTEFNDPFGEVIFSYSRTDALNDGVLVDVTETAKEVGIKYHTALTTAVHATYVQVPEELHGIQDAEGRLWDILWMLRVAIARSTANSDTTHFDLLVAMSNQTPWQDNENKDADFSDHRIVTLKAICGPDDSGHPCITIMKPNED
jgi:hypothetical protein